MLSAVLIKRQNLALLKIHYATHCHHNCICEPSILIKANLNACSPDLGQANGLGES